MSPDNINQVPSSEEPASSRHHPIANDDRWTEPSSVGGGTTWKAPQIESEFVASGSIAPTMTPSSLAANFLSGQLTIDWGYFGKIFIVLIMVGAIIFTGFLYYRDNELGRLQDIIGMQQFRMKAVGVALYSLVPISIIFLTLLIRTILSKRKQKKSN